MSVTQKLILAASFSPKAEADESLLGELKEEKVVRVTLLIDETPFIFVCDPSLVGWKLGDYLKRTYSQLEIHIEGVNESCYRSAQLLEREQMVLPEFV